MLEVVIHPYVSPLLSSLYQHNKLVVNSLASVSLFTAETPVYSQVIRMENLTANLLH